MTKHTNAELREMMERATSGEWLADTDTAQVVDDGGNEIAGRLFNGDARLIAAMHAELPRLLAESEALARVRTLMDGALETMIFDDDETTAVPVVRWVDLEKALEAGE